MKQLALILAISSAVLAGCKEEQKPAEKAAASESAAATTTNAPPASSEPAAVAAVNPVGSYKGMLPCASCEAIDTTLVLKEDGSYELTTLFVGEADAKPETVTGKYRISDDKTLVHLDDAGFNYAYLIGENQLEMRDADGGTGDRSPELAQAYRLQKQ